jgi:hypothetical protein
MPLMRASRGAGLRSGVASGCSHTTRDVRSCSCRANRSERPLGALRRRNLALSPLSRAIGSTQWIAVASDTCHCDATPDHKASDAPNRTSTTKGGTEPPLSCYLGRLGACPRFQSYRLAHDDDHDASGELGPAGGTGAAACQCAASGPPVGAGVSHLIRRLIPRATGTSSARRAGMGRWCSMVAGPPGQRIPSARARGG